MFRLNFVSSATISSYNSSDILLFKLEFPAFELEDVAPKSLTFGATGPGGLAFVFGFSPRIRSMLTPFLLALMAMYRVAAWSSGSVY